MAKKHTVPEKVETVKCPNVEMKQYYCEACSTWSEIKVDMDGVLVSVTCKSCNRVNLFKKENMR